MATKKSDVEKTVEPEAVETEVKVEKEEEEKVMVMIPFIPGQDPEETVWVNGICTKIKKGEQVMVSRPVASVLENSYEAQRIAMVNRANLKNQRTDL